MNLRVTCCVCLFLFTTICCCTLVATGQKKTQAKKPIKRDPPVRTSSDCEILNCRIWETTPEYPSCDTGWSHYLTRSIDSAVPKRNGASLGIYQVEVWFVVLKNGTVETADPLTHYGFGMEEELIRAIRQSPAWQPATRNGRKMSYRVKQIFRFIVKEPLIT